MFSWLGVVTVPGAVVLIAYLGLYWALFGWYAATLGNPWRGKCMATGCAMSLRYALGHGVVWAGFEVLRGWLFTGFGWNALGVAFHQSPVIAQGADVLGVSGLSILVVFFQSVLLQCGRRVLQAARDGRKRARWDFLVAAGVVAIALMYGAVRMQQEGALSGRRLKALLVQINIPQDAARVLWEPEQVHLAYEDETRKALESLCDLDSKRLSEMGKHRSEGEIRLTWPDWVIWPESALTGRLVSTADGSWGMWRENLETVKQVQSCGPFQLMQGMVELEGEHNPEHGLIEKLAGRAWNVLAVISSDGGLKTYRKRHLVIFGETIPFVEEIPLLKELYKQQTGQDFGGSFAHGDSADPLEVATSNGGNVGVIGSVCFEDTVPRLIRPSLRDAPQVIVNVTNDGWFKQSAAAAQHFANARFRCIEFRRPMLRSANSGVSAAVDTLGRVGHPDTGAAQVIMDSTGSHFTRGSRLVEIKVPQKLTTSLYALVGDWGIAGLALLVWVSDGLRRRSECQSATS